jgi:dinuclear metal center YbgI/SA1388 family protein
MLTIAQLCSYLESIAPLRLAEDWDNVGLLLGDPQRSAERVMTCLTVTATSAQEAIDRGVDLLVTHHPFPFRPLSRLTTESAVGRLLWQLARAGVAIYSPHTAWDSASMGINQQLAQGLGLTDIRPLQPIPDDPDELGSGRCGAWPEPRTLAAAIERVKEFLCVGQVQFVGRVDQAITQVAVACGSASSFLEAAHTAGCQLLLTGEARFHACLEATALGVALILPGHYASERFALETLARCLQQEFPDLEIWASREEADPLAWA